MESGAKQYDKEGALFGPQNVREADAQKWAFPVPESFRLMFLWDRLAFCILSTCKLARFGWKTTVGKHGVETTHEATGVKTTDVSVWHDTLWVLVEPYWEKDVNIKLEPVLFAIIGEMVSVLTPDEMAAHRLRGYILSSLHVRHANLAKDASAQRHIVEPLLQILQAQDPQ